MSKIDKKKKKLMRLAEVADEGDLAIVKHIDELDDKIDEEISVIVEQVGSSIAAIDRKATQALIIANETQKMEGKPGYSPRKGVDYNDGAPGKSYVITDKDINTIASKVKVPIVEKKIEIIKEIPVVREIIKETIRNDLSPYEIRDMLEQLPDDEKLDVKFLKNVYKLLNPPNGPMLHPVSLGNLPDVNVAGVQVGQSIVWNGTFWEPGSGGTVVGDLLLENGYFILLESGSRIIY